MATVEPRYEHDCPDCVLVGRKGEWDLYACPPQNTVVIRRADEPSEYQSGRGFTGLLGEAERLGMDAGLLPPPPRY